MKKINRVNYVIDNFKNIKELIRFTDQKAGAILMMYRFILSAFIQRTNNLLLHEYQVKTKPHPPIGSK